ncbi:MAG: CDP-diacylglycerol--serine O-phosphatidyltransferase [Candidatus Micrarchaeota archaeon]
MAGLFDELSAKDYLSLANAASGFIAIVSALLAYSFAKYFYAPFFFLLAALFFDYIDGFVARKTGKGNALGIQLDSLADVVSFGVFPAVLVSVFNFNSIFAVSFSVLFLAAGILRLARFNLQKEKGVYYGLPIPAAAFLVVSAFYLQSYLAPSADWLLYAAVLACAWLMLAGFRVKKPGFA